MYLEEYRKARQMGLKEAKRSQSRMIRLRFFKNPVIPISNTSPKVVAR